MKTELLMYYYGAICVAMILFNVVYARYLKLKERSLISSSDRYEEKITAVLDALSRGEGVPEKHKKELCRGLDDTAKMSAFDSALEKIYADRPELTEKYLVEIFSVFEHLTHRYINMDTTKIAYFPYILDKYNILRNHESERLLDIFYDLLRSPNVYCRENTIKALYDTGSAEVVKNSLRILDRNRAFHHPKLVTDGLLTYGGDRNGLKDLLFEHFDEFSVRMKVNILDFFRFGGVRCDAQLLALMADEQEHDEIRYSAIRYFHKFPSQEAEPFIRNFAENLEGREWVYQAIASSALEKYPSEAAFRILVANLSSPNWYVRQNSAVSIGSLGYTYEDLFAVFDGNDRYAREIMQYYLDRRDARGARV